MTKTFNPTKSILISSNILFFAILCFGGIELPTIIDSTAVVKHTGYTLEYNEKYEQAKWVAYILTKSALEGTITRTDNFREDPAIVTGSSKLADYKYSGFDRGHLAPAADFKWSPEVMSETFYLSNMSPQHPSFNRGIWSRLESKVRSWAKEKDSIYIVTSGILIDSLPTIGNNVAVPKYYYKVVLKYSPPIAEGIGFIMANEKSSEPLEHFSVPIDSIEKITGIDFYPALPDSIENKIEGTVNLNFWNLP